MASRLDTPFSSAGKVEKLYRGKHWSIPNPKRKKGNKGQTNRDLMSIKVTDASVRLRKSRELTGNHSQQESSLLSAKQKKGTCTRSSDWTANVFRSKALYYVFYFSFFLLIFFFNNIFFRFCLLEKKQKKSV